MNKKKPRKKLTDDPTRILTLANIISLLRAFSAIPIIYTIIIPEYQWLTAILIILAVLSDALDGYYARKYNLISKFGKYLDPIADKIFILSVLFTLHFLLEFYIPLWIVAIIFFRDLFVTILRNAFEKQNF